MMSERRRMDRPLSISLPHRGGVERRGCFSMESWDGMGIYEENL